MAAGILDQNWNDAEISGMSAGRLDPNLHRDAADSEHREARITQRHLQRRALKGRHSKLIEHEVLRLRHQLGYDGNARGITQELGLYLLRIVSPLPCHGLAHRETAHSWLGQ